MSDQKGKRFRRWPLILGFVLTMSSCKAPSDTQAYSVAYYNNEISSVELYVDDIDITTIAQFHTYVDNESPGSHSVSAKILGFTVFGPVDENYSGDNQTVNIGN